MKKCNLYRDMLFCGLLLCFSACEKYLEEMPQNKLKPSTTDDYEQLLNKAYLTEQVMPYLDILSDDVELIEANHAMPGADLGDTQLQPICGGIGMILRCRMKILLSRNFMRVYFTVM